MTERRREHAEVDEVEAVADDEAAGSVASSSERYHALTRFVETHRPDLVNPDNTELLSLVQQANQLPCADQTPTERLLDARLFRSLTRCGNVKARRLSFGDAPQTPLELVLALREKYKIEQPRIALEGEEWLDGSGDSTVTIDWGQLGENLTQMWHVVPGLKCMKGFTKEVEKKRRVTVTRRREKPNANVLKPEKHAARELTSSATETERNVNKIWHILQQEESIDGIPFSQLTLDHDSYPQTVVNAFNVMFLVKDLKVEMTVDEADALVIKPTKHQQQHSHAQKRIEDNQQAFIPMRHRMWNKWRSKVSRESCQMTANGVAAVQNGCLDGSESTELDVTEGEVSMSNGYQLKKEPQNHVNGKTPCNHVNQVETVDCVSDDPNEAKVTSKKIGRGHRRSTGNSHSGKLARRRLT